MSSISLEYQGEQRHANPSLENPNVEPRNTLESEGRWKSEIRSSKSETNSNDQLPEMTENASPFSLPLGETDAPAPVRAPVSIIS
jgi:hypothetical protein